MIKETNNTVGFTSHLRHHSSFTAFICYPPLQTSNVTSYACMCSTLQILLVFSSPEGYWLQFSIPCVYFVYTVWHSTGQHCSSMYACM